MQRDTDTRPMDKEKDKDQGRHGVMVKEQLSKNNKNRWSENP